MKLYFQALVGHTCSLLFINHGSANSLHSVLQICQFILVYAKISKAFFCASFSPLRIAFYQLSALDFPCFYDTPQSFFCFREDFFHNSDPFATLYQITRDSYFT